MSRVRFQRQAEGANFRLLAATELPLSLSRVAGQKSHPVQVFALGGKVELSAGPAGDILPMMLAVLLYNKGILCNGSAPSSWGGRGGVHLFLS